jgi:hypothetical protein
MLENMQICKTIMNLAEKSALEIHRELAASGIFTRNTQTVIAKALKVDQGTISRIANGDFKRVNKSVRAVCKYAQISTMKSSRTAELRSLVHSAATSSDPEKRKLAGIIGLAMDLLERS